MKNGIKIFIFLFIVALAIFFLKPWQTSDKLATETNGAQVVTPQVGAGTAPKGNRSRFPASVGNPGEASGLSVRE
jgi:hypothetical protein